MKHGWVCALLAAGLVARPAGAQQKLLETDDLRLVYGATTEYLAPYAARTFENALAADRARFGYVPDGKATVVLRDYSDLGNALIMSAPRNRIYYDIAPTNLAFETFSPGERLYTIANHESVHLVTTDGASSADATARRWLGGKVAPVAEHPESILYFGLTTPRNAAPRWYSEGAAVFMETWYGGGLGRAQGGYDEMVFRAMVRDKAKFYDPLGLVSEGVKVDFQASANAYLYGTRFMSYLALQYSPEQVVDWLRRTDGTYRSYSRDFERVFARPLDEAWQQWVAWEHEFQAANLASVRQHPITPYREVARRGLGALSRAVLSRDGREIYAGVRYPGRLPALVAIRLDDGTLRELTPIDEAMAYRVTSLAFDRDSDTLFYTNQHTNYRNVLAYDLKTGKSRTLLKEARIGDLAFNQADRSLWGLRTNNGFAIVVRCPYPYTEWQKVYVYPYAEVPFDLDLSPDGKLLSLSVAGPDPARGGTQVMQLRVMSTAKLLEGDATPLDQFELGTAMPEGFVFSPDGRYLYGSSYYTGVSNIYRYELATRKLEAVSNAEVGYFRPLPLGGDRLLVFHYAAEGFVPAIIEAHPTDDLSAITFLGEQVATRHPAVQSWGAGSPAQVDLDSRIVRKGDYSPFRELSRESIYPVLEGYKDTVALGAHARFTDPVGYDKVNLTLSYSPGDQIDQNERLHALVEYRHYLWTMGARWNAGDFYDLFGPTKRSREGWSVFADYERPLIYTPPRTLSVVGHLAYYGDLDSLPRFQNVESPSDKLGEAEIGLVYGHPRVSLGNVDDEAGYRWEVLAHAYEAAGDFTPSVFGKFDVGWQLPWRHSSIWVRTAAGTASGDRDNPLANAYFGGFGNNYVDNGEPKRYREVLSFPGFEIDALSGRSFGKGMLEWNLPPIRFERLGSPGFYGSWIRPALFTSALVTDPDAPKYRDEAYNAGVQFDLQLQVMHRLPMMISLGYAKGFDGDGQGEDEFMLSLKVL